MAVNPGELCTDWRIEAPHELSIYADEMSDELGLDVYDMLPDWMLDAIAPGRTKALLVRFARVGGVLVNADPPSNVIGALGRCRRVFVLGEFAAAVALCRSVAEAVAHGWLTNYGERVAGSLVWKNELRLLRRRRPDLRTLLDGVESIRVAANQILHPTIGLTSEEDGAFAALRMTFEFTERLYRR